MYAGIFYVQIISIFASLKAPYWYTVQVSDTTTMLWKTKACYKRNPGKLNCRDCKRY